MIFPKTDKLSDISPPSVAKFIVASESSEDLSLQAEKTRSPDKQTIKYLNFIIEYVYRTKISHKISNTNFSISFYDLMNIFV